MCRRHATLWQFSDDVCDALLQGIVRGVKRSKRRTMLEPIYREVRAHVKMAAAHEASFVGRVELREAVAAHAASAAAAAAASAASSSNAVVALHGRSGSGKSALMGCCALAAARTNPRASIILRFLGTTPRSSTVRGVLTSVCDQIKRLYDAAKDKEIPSDYQELVIEFPAFLACATAKQPIVLFLDSLDQLSDAGDAQSLWWFPFVLPPHVRVVVSTLLDVGAYLQNVRRRVPESGVLPLPPLSAADGEDILDAWLTRGRKNLNPAQREAVLGYFAGCPYPLYFRLIFEEACRWRSFTPQTQCALWPSVQEQIQDRFSHLMKTHGDVLVSALLGGAVYSSHDTYSLDLRLN